MNQKYKLLFLDMDETLFDFKKAERLSIKSAFEHNGLPTDSETVALYQEINGVLWKAVEAGNATTEYVKVERFVRLLKALGREGNPEKISGDYVLALAGSPYLLDGAKEFMETLHQSYKICIVTNGIRYNQYRRIEAAGLATLCDAMVVSEEAGSSKPSGGIFETAMARSGHTDKQSVLMIGDSLSSDIKGGFDFGVDTLWFNPLHLENKSNVTPTYEAANYKDIMSVLGAI